MTEQEFGGIYVLDEIWQQDISFSGSLYCPGCTNSICMLDWDGSINGFEAVCSNCGGDLFSSSTLAVSRKYYVEHGVPDADLMEEYVTMFWDTVLAEGRETEVPEEYECEGIIVDGEYQLYPDVKPVMESVDVTDAYVDLFERCAEDFRWDWVASHEE